MRSLPLFPNAAVAISARLAGSVVPANASATLSMVSVRLTVPSSLRASSMPCFRSASSSAPTVLPSLNNEDESFSDSMPMSSATATQRDASSALAPDALAKLRTSLAKDTKLETPLTASAAKPAAPATAPPARPVWRALPAVPAPLVILASADSAMPPAGPSLLVNDDAKLPTVVVSFDPRVLAFCPASSTLPRASEDRLAARSRLELSPVNLCFHSRTANRQPSTVRRSTRSTVPSKCSSMSARR